jgi:hypothetical protein
VFEFQYKDLRILPHVMAGILTTLFWKGKLGGAG